MKYFAISIPDSGVKYLGDFSDPDEATEAAYDLHGMFTWFAVPEYDLRKLVQRSINCLFENT